MPAVHRAFRGGLFCGGHAWTGAVGRGALGSRPRGWKRQSVVTPTAALETITAAGSGLLVPFR